MRSLYMAMIPRFARPIGVCLFLSFVSCGQSEPREGTIKTTQALRAERRARHAQLFEVPASVTPIAPMPDRSGRYVMRRRGGNVFFTGTGFAMSLPVGDALRSTRRVGVHCT